MLILIGVAIATFAATDIDDLFVLLLLFAERRIKPAHIVIGQFVGIGALTAVSLVLASTSLVMPARWLGLLGIFPLILGVLRLRRSGEQGVETIPAAGRRGDILAVASVTIANGGDNIAAYAPLFATTPAILIPIILLIYGLLILVWCWLARLLLRHLVTSRHLHRLAPIIVPWVLIFLGAYILFTAWWAT